MNDWKFHETSLGSIRGKSSQSQLFSDSKGCPFRFSYEKWSGQKLAGHPSELYLYVHCSGNNSHPTILLCELNEIVCLWQSA